MEVKLVKSENGEWVRQFTPHAYVLCNNSLRRYVSFPRNTTAIYLVFTKQRPRSTTECWSLKKPDIAERKLLKELGVDGWYGAAKHLHYRAYNLGFRYVRVEYDEDVAA